jgi:hypothetical protein
MSSMTRRQANVEASFRSLEASWSTLNPHRSTFKDEFAAVMRRELCHRDHGCIATEAFAIVASRTFSARSFAR